jgi:hypothetical protein
MKKPFLNVLVLALLLPVVAAMAQTVAHSFDGDTGPGETVCKTGVTHCAWPDMNAGVNGKQVVEVTCRTSACTTTAATCCDPLR